MIHEGNLVIPVVIQIRERHDERERAWIAKETEVVRNTHTHGNSGERERRVTVRVYDHGGQRGTVVGGERDMNPGPPDNNALFSM